MNILIIGTGKVEKALVELCLRSKNISHIYTASNNPIGDIPNIEYKHRLNLSHYIIDYFKETLKKRYMTNNNFYGCIEKIMESVSGFYVIDNPVLYGTCTPHKIGFNFSMAKISVPIPFIIISSSMYNK